MDGRAVDDPPLALDRQIADRMGNRRSPLSSRVIAAMQHIDALIRDTELTRDDLGRLIGFLTEVGQYCDTHRQEWVLLADVLGISTLVEDLNAPAAPGVTPSTLPGPFYRADAPPRANGDDLSLDGRGPRLSVTGAVQDTCGSPVAGAIVEVWQANGDGIYENQEPDIQPENNLRGVFTTDADGRFHFLSVKPKGYPLPDDGPVGRLFAHLGLPLHRPAHIHFRISGPGLAPLVTHVFDRDDPAIAEDALFSVKPDLLGEFRATGAPDLPWALDFTFVLARSGRETSDD